MQGTIIAVGNGGYNLASDLISANLFQGATLIICDTYEKDLMKNSANAAKSVLHVKLRGKDMPLVWIRSNTYHNISDEERKNIFYLY